MLASLKTRCALCFGVMVSVGYLFGATPALSQQFGQGEPAQESPLSCHIERITNKISCEVTAASASVKSATINGEACRSPVTVFEYRKQMIARITGQDISTLKDFRGDYKRGDTFSIYADRECAIYKYSVTVDERAWDFN